MPDKRIIKQIQKEMKSADQKELEAVRQWAIEVYAPYLAKVNCLSDDPSELEQKTQQEIHNIKKMTDEELLTSYHVRHQELMTNFIASSRNNKHEPAPQDPEYERYMQAKQELEAYQEAVQNKQSSLIHRINALAKKMGSDQKYYFIDAENNFIPPSQQIIRLKENLQAEPNQLVPLNAEKMLNRQILGAQNFEELIDIVENHKYPILGTDKKTDMKGEIITLLKKMKDQPESANLSLGRLNNERTMLIFSPDSVLSQKVTYLAQKETTQHLRTKPTTSQLKKEGAKADDSTPKNFRFAEDVPEESKERVGKYKGKKRNKTELPISTDFTEEPRVDVQNPTIMLHRAIKDYISFRAKDRKGLFITAYLDDGQTSEFAGKFAPKFYGKLLSGDISGEELDSLSEEIAKLPTAKELFESKAIEDEDEYEILHDAEQKIESLIEAVRKNLGLESKSETAEQLKDPIFEESEEGPTIGVKEDNYGPLPKPLEPAKATSAYAAQAETVEIETLEKGNIEEHTAEQIAPPPADTAITKHDQKILGKIKSKIDNYNKFITSPRGFQQMAEERAYNQLQQDVNELAGKLNLPPENKKDYMLKPYTQNNESAVLNNVNSVPVQTNPQAASSQTADSNPSLESIANTSLFKRLKEKVENNSIVKRLKFKGLRKQLRQIFSRTPEVPAKDTPEDSGVVHEYSNVGQFIEDPEAFADQGIDTPDDDPIIYANLSDFEEHEADSQYENSSQATAGQDAPKPLGSSHDDSSSLDNISLEEPSARPDEDYPSLPQEPAADPAPSTSSVSDVTLESQYAELERRDEREQFLFLLNDERQANEPSFQDRLQNMSKKDFDRLMQSSTRMSGVLDDLKPSINREQQRREQMAQEAPAQRAPSVDDPVRSISAEERAEQSRAVDDLEQPSELGNASGKPAPAVTPGLEHQLKIQKAANAASDKPESPDAQKPAQEEPGSNPVNKPRSS